MSERGSSTPDVPAPSEVWYAYVDLTARYAESVDLHAGEAVAELFEDDATWDATAFGLEIVEGRAALARHFGGSADSQTVHLVHNHRLVRVSGDEAVARSTAHSILTRPDGVRHMIVHYDDVIGCSGTWRFRRRVLRRGPKF